MAGPTGGLLVDRNCRQPWGKPWLPLCQRPECRSISGHLTCPPRASAQSLVRKGPSEGCPKSVTENVKLNRNRARSACRTSMAMERALDVGQLHPCFVQDEVFTVAKVKMVTRHGERPQIVSTTRHSLRRSSPSQLHPQAGPNVWTVGQTSRAWRDL